MLFNSLPFLFGFLPLALLVFALVERFASAYRKLTLIALSLLFYGYWDPRFLALIGASIGINYLLAQRLRDSRDRALLAIAIAFNLMVIGWFKYYNFLVGGLHGVGLSALPFLEIALPLGVSFFTFQQISYLVDNYRRQVPAQRLLDYSFVVTFFPHVIAGPIVRYAEIEPQLAADRPRLRLDDLALGSTLLVIGLSKKVLLADSLAVHADPVFQLAAEGHAPSLLAAWKGALAYTFQIYFDFSGYSDMALGLALMFGIRLPVNFNSPYKATSIIEFWHRWHISLSRFLRDYLYFPLGGSRLGPGRRYANILLVMLLGGLWHGAGMTFVLWGLLHGIYLVVNHGYRDLIAARLPLWWRQGLSARFLGWLLTFMAVVVAWVVFRASDRHAALLLLQSMLGLAAAGWSVAELETLPRLLGALLLLLWFSLALPNSQTLAGLDCATMPGSLQLPEPQHRAGRARLRWQPTHAWAVICGLLLAAVVSSLGKQSPFLYFQF
jgi:alginate O-acetyltransferase complex protein AlgI